MTVDRVINNNITSHIINSNIVEYNITKAYPTILNMIDNKYEYLLDLSKDQYIEEINKIFSIEPSIKQKIKVKTIELYNDWLGKNKINKNNFIATTTDSIIINNQLAANNTIDDIIFRNKDKISYTSLFYINKDIYILFDRITKKLKIQGVYNDPFINEYPFVTKMLKDICCICNEFTFETQYDCIKKLAKLRYRYINSDDKTIYGDILHFGEYKYNIDGNTVYTSSLYDTSDDINLVIEDNYLNFILPLIKSMF
jgi:hypothetical protein